MKKVKIAALVVLGGLAALTVFHVLHYLLFCRHRGVPGKSHCGVCGHRSTCRKYHKKMHQAAT